MSELHLRNSFVVLIVITVLAMIFLANFIMPPLSEKMICGLHGGQWDTMLHVCAFDLNICADAGGAPVQVFGKCGESKQCNATSVSTIGCKFE